MSHPLWSVLLVALPLFAAVSIIIFGKRSVLWVLIATFMGIGVALSQLIILLLQQGPQYDTLAGWTAPLGIEWYFDGLTALMLIMTAVVNGLIAISIWQSPSQTDRQQGLFWPQWLLLWTGLNALYLSADLFNLYVSLALINLTQVIIISGSHDRAAWQAAMRYLLVTMTASLSYLLGIAFLYAAYGTVDMTLLAQEIEPLPTTWMAIGLILIGLFIQTALFPGHFWLPVIYRQATPFANSLLTGLIFNSVCYLLLRFWLEIFPHDTFLTGLAYLLGLLGAIAIIYGALQAMRQTHPLSLLAYSVISQFGFFLLFFPLLEHIAPAWQIIIWHSAIYQFMTLTLVHTALLLSLGHFWPLDTNHLALLKSSLITRLTWLLAALSLLAVPPTGGFFAKWWFIQTAVANEQWGWAIITVIGVIMTVGYCYQVFKLTINRSKVTLQQITPLTLHWQRELIPLILMILVLSLGLFSQLPLMLLEIGSPFMQ